MSYKDSFERPIQYLRVSVTDRCNLRCVYCMPEAGITKLSRKELLTYEQIVRIVRVAVAMGFIHIRLTGGEPLVREGIVDLVSALASIPGLDDLSMTTNGLLLSRFAEPLAQAGLRRINISLDTLRPERFVQITRRGQLENVLEGHRAALAAGLKPVKLNAVVIRGLNDDEVVDLARLTLEPDYHLRFIEIMPLGGNRDTACYWTGDGVVPTAEVRTRIEQALGPLTAVKKEGAGAGPARYYRLPGAAGTLGFISPITEHFCHACNRLRLTSDGKLLPCLLSDVAIDLHPLLEEGLDEAQLGEIFRQAIAAKPRSHSLEERSQPECLPMSRIGG